MENDLLQHVVAYFQLLSKALLQFSPDTVVLTAVLVFMAEIGDKSQIVCMTLAARHRGLPVLLGAVIAFAMLNLLAVVFGVIVANTIPEIYVASVVALLFLIFGLQSLFAGQEDLNQDEVPNLSSHSILLTAFLMIFIAEFGDKTQIAVAGLSVRFDVAGVWLGATLALAITSALAVWVGRRLLQHIPIHMMQRLSGVVFLLIGLFAVMQILQIYGLL